LTDTPTATAIPALPTETTPVPQPKAEVKAPTQPKRARKPRASKAEKVPKIKPETNGKVPPAEVAAMIEKLVTEGSSVKDAAASVAEKLGRPWTSLMQTYYRVKREGSTPAAKPGKTRKPRAGKSLADSLTTLAASLREVASEVRAIERQAVKSADAEARLVEVRAKLKGLA
jgi:hypothetical protein